MLHIAECSAVAIFAALVLSIAIPTASNIAWAQAPGASPDMPYIPPPITPPPAGSPAGSAADCNYPADDGIVAADKCCAKAGNAGKTLTVQAKCGVPNHTNPLLASKYNAVFPPTHGTPHPQNSCTFTITCPGSGGGNPSQGGGRTGTPPGDHPTTPNTPACPPIPDFDPCAVTTEPACICRGVEAGWMFGLPSVGTWPTGPSSVPGATAANCGASSSNTPPKCQKCKWCGSYYNPGGVTAGTPRTPGGAPPGGGGPTTGSMCSTTPPAGASVFSETSGTVTTTKKCWCAVKSPGGTITQAGLPAGTPLPPSSSACASKVTQNGMAAELCCKSTSTANTACTGGGGDSVACLNSTVNESNSFLAQFD